MTLREMTERGCANVNKRLSTLSAAVVYTFALPAEEKLRSCSACAKAHAGAMNLKPRRSEIDGVPTAGRRKKQVK
jgi:hypothetical protein